MSGPGGYRAQRKTPWLARILAPLALIGVLVVIVILISGSTGGEVADTTGGGGSGGGQKSQKSQEGDKGEKGSKPPKEYVIEPGDTLSGIAEQFGLSTAKIERLNPDLDPTALVTGATIKLR